MNTTCDKFLNGALQIIQPAHGFRAGVDAVLLAAACPAQKGESVLELGCGVGTAALCLAKRVPVEITGLELQQDYANLARRNAIENDIGLEVICGDLNDLPHALRQKSFNHIIANPPYFSRAHGTKAQDQGRDTALGGDTTIATWLEVAAKRLAPKGWLTMIQRIDRLPDILRALPKTMGSIGALPISARQNRPAHLVIIRARKDGRAPFHLCAPFVMHEGTHHIADGNDYTPETHAILRHGAALPFTAA